MSDGHPFRTAPSIKHEIDGATLVVILDTMIGSLRICGPSAPFRYTEDTRKRAADAIMDLMENTGFTITVSRAQGKPED